MKLMERPSGETVTIFTSPRRTPIQYSGASPLWQTEPPAGIVRIDVSATTRRRSSSVRSEAHGASNNAMDVGSACFRMIEMDCNVLPGILRIMRRFRALNCRGDDRVADGSDCP